MKFLESSFEEYLQNINKINLHPYNEKKFKKYPNDISDLKHTIIYGPIGSGKYSQSLNFVSKYSKSSLKYEKKIIIEHNKIDYVYKMSDIHFEIDMSLLGCNSKQLWHEIYNHIIDITNIKSKQEKNMIIMCKNFHEIHPELLEIFYSYMQEYNNLSVNLIFLLITEHISFIPENILESCSLISIPRPTRINYNKCLKNNSNIKLPNNYNITTTTNIKNNSINIDQIQPVKIICEKIIYYILNYESLKFVKFRDYIYNIFIYQLDIYECIWYIVSYLTRKKYITEDKIDIMLKETYLFLKYYNNNYRPIYHLEKYFLVLITIINDIKVLS